jgi:(R,R)-butanediol dehydrogenase / meso-butanediol dehydrogenase / diacetyl reductase
MKAAMYFGHRDLRVLDVPEPEPGPGQVKVQVAWAGICGTDRHEYTGPVFIPVGRVHRITGRTAPLVLGHEFSGVVAAVGAGVTAWRPGDRVTASGNIVCGQCHFCRTGRVNLCENLAFTGIGTDGAFAEYVVVPQYQLFKVPASVSLERAVLTEPLACGEHATGLLGEVKGRTVVVIGPGIIGLSCVVAARAAGAARILVVGLGRANEAHARRLGADEYLDSRGTDPVAFGQAWLDAPGFDIAYECAGFDATIDTAVKMTCKGSRIMVMGVYERNPAFPMNLFQEGERTLLSSQAYVDELGTVLARMERDGLEAERLLTGRISLDRIVEDGFEELLAHPDRHIKIAMKVHDLA